MLDFVLMIVLFLVLNYVLMIVLLLVIQVAMDITYGAFKSWCSCLPV